jgi:hypothetical protein
MHELALEHEWNDGLMDVTPRCPKCMSPQLETRNLARRFGGAIGALAGTTSGVLLALNGAKDVFLRGPLGALLGTVAGLVIEGIVSGATGCMAGSKLGSVIDRNILHNHQCSACGHTFGDKS